MRQDKDYFYLRFVLIVKISLPCQTCNNSLLGLIHDTINDKARVKFAWPKLLGSWSCERTWNIIRFERIKGKKTCTACAKNKDDDEKKSSSCFAIAIKEQAANYPQLPDQIKGWFRRASLPCPHARCSWHPQHSRMFLWNVPLLP